MKAGGYAVDGYSGAVEWTFREANVAIISELLIQ